MRPLADRIHATDASGIRKVFDLAASLASPVNLSIGQPDFDVPDAVKDAAVDAIRSGKNSYSPTQGAAPLVQALAERLGKAEARYSERQILVTGAVSGGLSLGYMALLNPGDEIIVPDPYFVIYKQMALMLGARPVFLDTYPDFRIDPEKLAALVTPRTRAIVLGSPSNPTGAVYSRGELEAVAALCRKHDLVVLSDEIYEDYWYDAPPASIAELAPERALLLRGWSKGHAMTGWRVGYAAGPEPLIQAMAKLQQYTFVCAPAPAQWGALAALAVPTDAMRAEYRRRRDLMVDGLSDAGYNVVRPAGAFYVFPELPGGGRETDEAFVGRCIKNNLLVIPGGVFSERKTHFRIAYTRPEEVLREGLRILRAVKNADA